MLCDELEHGQVHEGLGQVHGWFGLGMASMSVLQGTGWIE